jgi:fructose-1-phosphate kinase PfkB-like protein
MVAAAAMKMAKGAPLPEILRAGVAAGTARVTTVERVSFAKEKYEEIYAALKISEI